jgi:cytoskeletal protein CcmA (bactofilin family)
MDYHPKGSTVKDDQKNFSIIDEGFTIDGTVTGKGRLVVKGTIKGAIQGDSVVIAKEGAVYADARAGVMTIGGIFEGEVEVEKELTILSSGKCSGKVKCRDLVVEAGGVLNATVTSKTAVAAKIAKPTLLNSK